jgi:Fur family transcriptional regulator, zinc uptake regulator
MTLHDHAHEKPELTKNQTAVYEALEAADGPLTAYNILDRLSGQGFRAPLQVYRALDKLQEFGVVHRLESLNAFVACRHPGCDDHETVAFTICEDCGQVSEITDDALVTSLRSLTGGVGFSARKTTVEIRGACSACRNGG